MARGFFCTFIIRVQRRRCGAMMLLRMIVDAEFEIPMRETAWR